MRRSSFFVVAIGSVLSCANPGRFSSLEAAPSIVGRVIDVSTGAPLSEVNVLAEYTRETATPAHSTEVCYRAEYMKTSADGTYHFPIDGNGVPNIEVYKHGYRDAQSPRGIQERLELVGDQKRVRFYVIRRGLQNTNEWIDEGNYATREEAASAARTNDKYLRQASGDRSERFSQLWRYLSATVCINGRDTRKNTVPFMSAARGEMMELATTSEDVRQLQLADELIQGERNGK